MLSVNSVVFEVDRPWRCADGECAGGFSLYPSVLRLRVECDVRNLGVRKRPKFFTNSATVNALLMYGHMVGVS